jgi:hypothetical protein
LGSNPRPTGLHYAAAATLLNCVYRVELHLCGLIGTAIHPDKQKIQLIGFFSENRLHWQFEVRLLLFTVRTCA